LVPSTKERYYQVRRRRARPGRLATLTQRAKYGITEWPPNALSRRWSHLALTRELADCRIRAPLVVYDHHHCHAATAVLATARDRCTVITVDGVGDGASTTVNLFERGTLTRLATTPARHSLGVFFEHVTHLLNMRELEDEGKVMALADYASPIEDAANPLLPLVRVEGLTLVTAEHGYGLRARLRDLQWAYPNEQFAFMAQRVVERRLVDLALASVARTGVPHVALAGGVASNIKATRQVRLCGEVEDVSVFPHMGDGGLAAGAALCAAMDSAEVIESLPDDLGLGPSFDEADMRTAIEGHDLRVCEPPDLADEAARRLARDKVVLWFQGRMEYGPRALGHRSVLARPDRPALRDRINLLLKRRVWYQPFCPSLLENDAQRAFSDLKGQPNRHMTMAYLVAAEYRSSLAGVINVDGSCRPQVVREDASGPFADLLRAGRRRWGIGAVLNTSLNIHGEPLVQTPAEAVNVLLTSGADALVIGRWLVTRPNSD
jgi:carbamoyltransferase